MTSRQLRHPFLRVFSFVAALLLLACTAPALKGPPPFLGQEAQTRLNARFLALQSLEGDFKLDYREGLVHERVDLYLAVSRPGNLTLELSGPLGLVVAATSNATQFVFYDARKKLGYAGPPDPEIISRLLPIGLDPQELVPLLLAAPKPLGGDISQELSADRRVGLWRLSLTDAAAGLVQQLWFGADGNLAKVRLTRRGRLVYEAGYTGYGEAQGPTASPRFITLRHGARPKATIKLSVRGEATINTPLPADRFELALPPDCDRLIP